MLRRALVALVLLTLALPGAGRAQTTSTGLIDPSAARRMGLERMWFTQIPLDRSRGRMAGLFQQVSSTKTRIVFETLNQGIRSTYSTREFEEVGRPLRDVAVIAVLAEPADPAAGPAAKSKFRVTVVAKGDTLAAVDQMIEVPYVGASRKDLPFVLMGSELVKAQPPEIAWWRPIPISQAALKYLASPGTMTPGVDRALQNVEQDLARIKLNLGQANAGQSVADDSLPEVDLHIVPEISLYGSANRGTVAAIDGETGRTRWSVTVGSPDHPTTVPGANDDYVAVLNGSTLYVLNAADGSTVWTRQTNGAPGAGPAISETLVFAPMINGSIEIYDITEPRYPAGVFRSFGRAMTQPVLSASSVAWATDRGNLYVGNSQVPDMRFRVEAKDSIESAPAFLSPDVVFATSRDGYVYCFTENRGTMLWRFTTGEPISHSPVPLGETVYAITDRGNMHALNVADAREKWLASGIRRFLAGSDKRLYCIDIGGNLTILSADSGSVIGRLQTVGMDLHFCNLQTDRIILGTKSGLVQSLRESEAYWPVIHFGELKKARAKQPPQGARPAAPAGGAPAVDPFAAPGGAVDPFAAPAAGGGAGADPFAAPPAGGGGAGADPFAAPPAGGTAPAADPFATP
jgi:outer membrane protein assembly factor BamB